MSVLRWLLRMDQPAPARSAAEISAEVERHYPWNFFVNLMDGLFFSFGSSFASSTTILPLFVSKLSDNPLPIGVVAMLAQGGWYVPQLFTANAVERLACKKPVVINLGLFLERMPLGLFVLAAALAGRQPALALVLVLLGYAWHSLGSGMVATAWQDMLASCFPIDRRGRFFGTTNFVGAGAGAVGAGFSTWLLRAYVFPTNFVYVFAIAAGAIFISWVWLAQTREPVQPSTAQHQGLREFLASLPELLRGDHNFRRFLTARLLMSLGGMSTGFVTVAAIARWHVADSTVGVYTAALLAGQTIGNLAFGFIADRFGHKPALEVGIASSLLGFALAWLAPDPGWYYGVFFLMGIGSGAVLVSGILVVMEFCEPERRPTYLGVANTSIGLVGLVAPLIGAGLAEIGYAWLFSTSVCVYALAGILMHRWVRDPRWQRAGGPVTE